MLLETWLEELDKIFPEDKMLTEEQVNKIYYRTVLVANGVLTPEEGAADLV